MKSSPTPRRLAGFGLIEFMLAMALGIVVIGGVIAIFIAERQVYQNSSSQTLIQDDDNAISAVITPFIRGAGFTGCGTLTPSLYLTGATTSLPFETSSAVQGFTGTMPTEITDNAANDSTLGDWTPALDGSLSGAVEKGSDVLTLMGAVPLSWPVGVTAYSTGSITVDSTKQLQSPSQLVALSNCQSSTVFIVTGISTSTGVVTFASGNGPVPTTYGYEAGAPNPQGPQLIPMQQTAFFVAKGDGNQSALFRAVMTPSASGTASGATWTATEAVPGVVAMKVLYGIGSNYQTTEYVDASAVTNWGAVYTIKLAFLVEGNLGSSPIPSSVEKYTLLNSTVEVPADSRLRHVFNMTVNMRNTTL